MWISRVRVTGGFLGGLDLTLAKGLNVVIGPRGAGKTTLLELIRHAVGAQHADTRAIRERQAFLDAVLGDGEVIVDVQTESGGRHLVVDSKGGGRHGDLSNSVLVLGQNELEEIASDAASRLRLLDLRTGAVPDSPAGLDAGPLTVELYQARAEIKSLKDLLQAKSRVLSDRELLLSQESAILGGSTEELLQQREQLRLAEERVIRTGRELEMHDSISRNVAELVTSQERQSDALADVGARISNLAVSDEVRKLTAEARTLSTAMIDVIIRLRDGLDRGALTSRQRNIEAREQSAPIRAQLEAAEAGLGQITAQLRNIDTELKMLEESEDRLKYLRARYSELAAARSVLFEDREKWEEAVFRARDNIAKAITSAVASNVVVVVDHLADTSTFRRFLGEAVKGSGIRATTIEALSSRVLPHLLLELVEEGDVDGLGAVGDLSHDSARRLIDILDDEAKLAGLAGIQLSDQVDFRLRDGAIEKSVDVLSTGQKCAVTLPVLLSEPYRSLILDQPEDHLDNAYLVKNVIKGLQSRRDASAQTIVATHNANIPVLGSAERVIVLASDGRNGHVSASGPFDDEPIVDSITGLMEGGRDAFARRSLFYAEHGGL